MCMHHPLRKSHAQSAYTKFAYTIPLEHGVVQAHSNHLVSVVAYVPNPLQGHLVVHVLLMPLSTDLYPWASPQLVQYRQGHL